MATANISESRDTAIVEHVAFEASSSSSSGEETISTGTRYKKGKKYQLNSSKQSVLFTTELSSVTVQSLFSVQYSSLMQNPSPNFRNLPFEDVLQQLVDFEYGAGYRSQAIWMEMLENRAEMEHTGIRQMMQEEELQLSLKTCSRADLNSLVTHYPNKASNKGFMLLSHLISILDEVLLTDQPMVDNEENREKAYTALRRTLEWIAFAAGYTTKLLTRAGGECRQQYERMYYPQDTSSQTAHVTVRGAPDFVFGPRDGSQHSIPVDVYSPLRVQEKSDKDMPGSLSSTQQAESASSSDSIQLGAVDSLVNCSSSIQTDGCSDLKDCLPDTTQIMPHMTQSHRHEFEAVLSGRHVTHLYGIAMEAVKTMKKDPRSGENMVILGMVLMNEYCFFSKMTVSVDFLMFCPQPSSKSLFKELAPKVRFLPSAIDLTQFNHRLALICFLSQHNIKYFPDPNPIVL